ncbi:MAG: M48 family metalloprotease [Fimbriimonadaceae bacterium]|nr:M48 family metalloprotease [Fimbriimonadaceae bacterium]QYK57479.1 MAG: M48 family metalloprotease [Fimbriimonadaceae bacterium]
MTWGSLLSMLAVGAPTVSIDSCGLCGPLPAPIARMAQQVEDRHKKDLDGDVKLGREVAEQVAKEMPPSENRASIERVQRIGQELASIANAQLVSVSWGDPRLNPFSYEFTVLQGKDVNAFSLPGGFIYLYEGLVDFAESDDELAGVLAHEIAHASFRHVAYLRREQSKLDVINIPLILAAIFSRSRDAGAIVQGTGLVNQAVLSGWSVKAEEAADYGGLQYMLVSRYNPVGILTFMERLAFRDRGRPVNDWGIYQTHPPSSDRAQALLSRLRALKIELRRSEVTTSLRSSVVPGDDGTVELLFGKNRVYAFGGSEALTRADEAAVALNALMDSVPALYELSLRNGTEVFGQGRQILEALPADGEQPEAKAQAAFQALRRIIFDLNYKLWPNHDRAAFPG